MKQTGGRGGRTQLKNQSRRCFRAALGFAGSAKNKLDGVAPLMTDPPPISSTTLSEKNEKEKNVTRDT